MAAEIQVAPLRYNTVAASQTAQVLIGQTSALGGDNSGGGTGAVGDILEYVEIVPATTSPGVVTLVDGATSISLFAGGVASVVDLKPFTVVWGARSQNGAYKITTGANVSVIAFGRFT